MNHHNESKSAPAQAVIHWPWITMVLMLVAVLAQCDATITEALEYNRSAIVSGQWWRLISGHFTHWTAAQFIYDGAAFLVLGGAVEWIVGRRRLLMCVTAAAAVISVWLCATRPELAHYRGLSGIDSALLFVVGIFLLRRAVSSRDRPMAMAAAGLLVAVSLKSVLEMATGSPLVVADVTSFTPILQTHWLGGAAGIVVALFLLTKDRGAVPVPKRASES